MVLLLGVEVGRVSVVVGGLDAGGELGPGTI